jgi:hypothetical protein
MRRTVMVPSTDPRDPVVRVRSVPNFRQNLDFLVALVMGEEGEVERAIRSDAVDWQEFQAFARYHQLSGYVYTLLQAMPLSTTLPPPVRSAFDARVRSEARKRDILLPVLIEIRDAFARSGPDIILLKGPHLAERFYGSVSARTFWDIDLLVRREDLGRARERLEDLGFGRQSFLPVGQRLSLWFAHAIDYQRGEIGLDLHWLLSRHPVVRIDYDRVWRRREAWALRSRRFDVISDDYALTANLLSSVKDIERGAFRLRSFVDLLMMLLALDPVFDWKRYFEERREEGVLELCSRVLVLFLDAFRAGHRVPRLAQAVRDPRADDAVGRCRRAAELLAPDRSEWARRWWASGLYGAPRIQHFAWWALSLPVRMAVHRAGKSGRQRRGRGGSRSGSTRMPGRTQ